MQSEVTIEKLVHGGQGLGNLPDGRKVFVWNALPGEKVRVRLTQQRKDYAEGIAEEILQVSPERIEAKDEAYLSTSPWQIMDFAAENTYKQAILTETMERGGVAYQSKIDLIHDDTQWHYRNKMEYSFWADDMGLRLALFQRASHGKQIVAGSSIAQPEIDMVANKICAILSQQSIRGSQLKTVIVRCNQKGEVVAALFVKDQKFPKIQELADVCKGIGVYFSNPKSPASVITKELYVFGDLILSDKILGEDIAYDVHSFFQVNVPMFNQAAERIHYFTGEAKEKVDLYAGVGTLALPTNATKLVEIDARNIAMAKQNVGDRPIAVIQASTETALDHITATSCLIVDPPRAGLHQKVLNRIREVKSPTIAYLSCNPSTQARDVALLQDLYTIRVIEGYNFFPRTPHIESLAILERT